jgi:hypothetical protein
LNSQKIVAIGASSILALDAAMLLLDERLAIFPLVLGLDLRYVLTLGLVGIGAIRAVVRRVLKK